MPIISVLRAASLRDGTFPICEAGRLRRWGNAPAAAIIAVLSLLFVSPARAQTDLETHATVPYVTLAGDTLYDVAKR